MMIMLELIQRNMFSNKIGMTILVKVGKRDTLTELKKMFMYSCVSK